jgi:hypothetical protein
VGERKEEGKIETEQRMGKGKEEREWEKEERETERCRRNPNETKN